MLEKQLTSKSYKATHEGWELNITENIGEESIGISVSGNSDTGGHLHLDLSNENLSLSMNPYDISVVTFLVNHFTEESEGTNE